MDRKEIEERLDKIQDMYGWLKEEITSLKLELSQPEKKPELWHGDYGYVWDEGKNEKPSRFVIVRHKGDVWWSRFASLPALNTLYLLKQNKYTVLGNIFDDLKALSEPLEEFEYEGCAISIDKDGNFDLDNIAYVNKKDIPDFILKLRRLQATKGK